jgi:3-hydroxyisobutyrate dehydrogenase
MDKVGFVGAGAMGSALIERLSLAGIRPTVYDAEPTVLAGLAAADKASSAAEVARASTIVDVVVRSDQDVLDCVLGKGGVLEGAEPNALILLHSTILPKTTREVANAAREREVHVIDACMVGVPSVVRAGNVSFLVGGPTDLLDRAKPHLLRMGKQVLHMGDVGAGNAAKLIKNLVTGSETLIIHEAIRIGEAAGIPYPRALEMMRQVDHGSLLHDWQRRFDPSGANSTPQAGTNIFQKDVPLAAELGRQLGLDLPITEQLNVAGKKLVELSG